MLRGLCIWITTKTKSICKTTGIWNSRSVKLERSFSKNVCDAFHFSSPTTRDTSSDHSLEHAGRQRLVFGSLLSFEWPYALIVDIKSEEQCTDLWECLACPEQFHARKPVLKAGTQLFKEKVSYGTEPRSFDPEQTFDVSHRVGQQEGSSLRIFPWRLHSRSQACFVLDFQVVFNICAFPYFKDLDFRCVKIYRPVF